MFNKTSYNFKIAMFNEKVTKSATHFFAVNGTGESSCSL